MKIAVLMMFRDEEDILERCLEHWLQVCPSVNFYLVDNLSKDRSYEIASKFTTCIFKENKNDWPGRENYNRLHHIARKEGCDWYFPADADEFLAGLREHGILMGAMGKRHIRAVTHYGISTHDIEETLEGIRHILR